MKLIITGSCGHIGSYVAENIFKIARVACARFLANSGEKRERTKEKREEKRRRDKKERQNNKKGRQGRPPFLFVCLFGELPFKARILFESSSSSSVKKKRNKILRFVSKTNIPPFFFVPKKTTHERGPTLQKCVLPSSLPSALKEERWRRSGRRRTPPPRTTTPTTSWRRTTEVEEGTRRRSRTRVKL